MRRRLFLLTLIGWPLLAADAQQQVLDLFTKIAGALSDDDPMVFLAAVDHDMPHFQDFQSELMALTDQADITNSIEVVTDQGDDTHRVEELDWFMQIVDKSIGQDVERRRAVVRFKLERRGKKKWKIVGIEPWQFFRPPKAGYGPAAGSCGLSTVTVRPSQTPLYNERERFDPPKHLGS